MTTVTPPDFSPISSGKSDPGTDDPQGVSRLPTLTTHLQEVGDFGAQLEVALVATIALQGADFGNIQVYDPATRTLRIAAQRGFGEAFLAAFASVSAETPSACGRALALGQRVVIADVDEDPDYAPYRAEAAMAGYRAVQSTPLLGRDGALLGVLSTHFRHPHHPSDHELQLTDLYARFAGQVIEQAQAEAGLRDSEARLATDLAGMRRLYDLYARLANETDLQVALDEIVAAANEVLGTDRGCIQLVSDDGERLEMFAYRGYDEQDRFIQHFLHEGSKPACDAARRDRRRLIIDDVATFPALLGTTDREVALADGIRATQSTPMIGRSGELVGVLSNQFPQPHRPSADLLRLIDLLAWTAADFVERHQATEAVRVSQERLQRMLNIPGVGVLVFDGTGTLLEANDAFLAMTGYSRDLIDSRLLTWRTLTPPDYVAASEEQLERLAAEGRIGPYEKEYLLADGSRSWMMFAGADLGDGTIVEYVFDVSDRKRMEEALRDSEAALQQRVAEGTTELRALSRRLLEVQEAERHHLARELHDEIGQVLTGLNFQLAAAAGKHGQAALAQAQATVQALTEQVRQLSMELRPAVLDGFGLLAAVQWYAEHFQQRTGIAVDLRHTGLDGRLAPQVEIGAYRVVQEALTNVARHAGARQANVQLLADGVLTVMVRDAGRGFDAAQTTETSGLGGMRERVALLGGTLEIETATGTGTVVTAEIPLDGPAALPGRADTRPDPQP